MTINVTSMASAERGVRPPLSVIVPAHQAAGPLPECLAALRASANVAVPWELVVVDDASTDDTSLVAAAYADVVVRLRGNPHGPAYARNRGVEASTGDILVFVDADVIIHGDALSRIVEVMRDPEVSAVFGAYDASPRDEGLVSQYRNLLHHHVHMESAGPAETFWAGLGAIRRDHFDDIGMFDEWHYSRPQIEDIELGRRLRRSGFKVLLEPEIQGTHLKRWTLRGMLATDIAQRGIPWMRLLLHEGPVHGSPLNLRLRHRWSAGLVGLGMLAVAGSVIFGIAGLALAGTAALLIALGLNWRFLWYLRRIGGVGLLLGALPLHLLFYVNNILAAVVGWLTYQLIGHPHPPPETEALALVGVQTWPPSPARPSRSMWSAPRSPSPSQRERPHQS